MPSIRTGLPSCPSEYFSCQYASLWVTVGISAKLYSGGGDGIQVELVLGNEDDDGVATYGYEEAVTEAFTQATGKNAFDLPNSDIDWLKFRATYVTEFLKES